MNVQERALALERAVWKSVSEAKGSIQNILLTALQDERRFAQDELIALQARVKGLERDLAMYKKAVER